MTITTAWSVAWHGARPNRSPQIDDGDHLAVQVDYAPDEGWRAGDWRDAHQAEELADIHDAQPEYLVRELERHVLPG